jgi:DEAD/DEAH box helicase domain-containing protein
MVFYSVIIEQLSVDPSSKVLAVYPLKALGREQEERLGLALQAAGINALVRRIDGQVPSHCRLGMLKEASVLIATPDIIHAWLLSSVGESAVRGFLKRLRLVIVDEVHHYTGVFGSNAAFLFRRVQHLCALLGASLRYITASATIADPGEHLQKLLGATFTIIGPEADSSPRQPVKLLLVTPPNTQDLMSSVSALFKHLATDPSNKFIAFVDSRKQVEYLSAILARSDDGKDEKAFDLDHLQRMNVLPFRAGYEVEDRNKIQDRISSGRMRGVISTSALELGIDVPHLTTGVLVGVPPSQTSLMQRIGRIGRHSPGVVIIVNRGDLQDEQAFRDADDFMSRPLTRSSLYLENQRIQYLHALCLARHGGEHDQIREALKLPDEDFQSQCEWPAGFLELCRKERIGEVVADLQPMKMEAGDDPNHVFPLRDVESQFQVELKQGLTLQSLGSLSHAQVLREAYPGGIYYCVGRPYRVYRIYQQTKKIQVRQESYYTTKPQFLPTLVFPNISPGNVHFGVRFGDLTVIDCNLQIREILTGYTERRGPNEFPVYYPMSFAETGVSFDLPRFTRNYFTTGIVITHPALSSAGVRAEDCAQLLLEAFLSLVPFERQDLGAAADKHRADKPPITQGQMFIALHDQTYGSLRLASGLTRLELLRSVFDQVLKMAETSNLAQDDATTWNALNLIRGSIDEQPSPLAYAAGPSTAVSGSTITVILPGSKGLNIRRNNEEFMVDRAFYSPKVQGLAYKGKHLGTTDEDVVEIVPVDFIESIPGESKLGRYDVESGEISDL